MPIHCLHPRRIALALLLAVSSVAIAQPDTRPSAEMAVITPLPAQLQDFDAYVEGVRKQFEVPGIAVAIIKDGEVVLERGYGVRELGKPEPVDAQTLFAIASNTKAFTAASLSMLADAGNLSLDDRVVDHLPWFQMSDPYITREMRVRDLLAHRSGLGLGAGDLLYWPGTDYTTREVAQRLRHVPLTGSFRGQYAYDNILYGVAQLVIEQVSGQPYAQFLQSRIFAPLGVEVRHVVPWNPADRWLVAEGGMRSVVIVSVHPRLQGRLAVGAVLVGGHIRPFA